MPVTLATTAVDTFEHIIRQQTVQELVPFLLNLPKADVVAVRKKTRSLQRELEQIVELSRGTLGSTWGRRGTPEQDWMLFLAGLRTYTRKEALTASFGVRWLEPQERPTFWMVVEHVRPDWLGNWLQRWFTTNQWNTPQYRLLRELEERQLIDYQPAMFAAAAPALLQEISRRFQGSKTVPANLTELVLAELQADATLLTRDLPLVFDYDTSVDTVQVWAQDERPLSNGLFKGNWQEWYEQHPPRTVRWDELLPALVASGHLGRADLLTRCLLALRRDFRRPLLTWFKNLFRALQPSAAERLQWQTELVELLAHPLPLVVNFALDQLKSIWLEPGFEVAPLLQYAEGLTTRQDLKSGLRTLLTGLEKRLKQQPAEAAAVARLAAAVLANVDNAVQERAAKLLVNLLGARKPLLTAEEADEAVTLAAQYTDLLGAAARTLLAPFLTAASTADPTTTTYVPHTGFVPELSAATAIVPVRDWHELLFLTGPVLQHNDPVALERWLDGLLRLRRHFPADYAEPLQPYLKQALPHLQHKTPAEQAAALGNFSGFGHGGLVDALLVGWASGFVQPVVEKVDMKHQGSPSDPLMRVEQQRLLEVERRLRASAELGLLSTPTHAPCWVAPSALVERLLMHQAAGQQPSAVDLALALARTAHAHATEAAAAQALLPQLQDAALRELLDWFLGPQGQPLPPLGASKSLLNRVVGRLRELMPAGNNPAATDEALPQLWVVAARTKQPEAYFPELRTISTVPGTTAPWNPDWVLTPKTRTYVEHWKVGKPEKTERWVELDFPAVYTSKVPPALLLYAQHTRFAGMLEAGWTLGADYPFLAAMLPNNATPLHWHTVRVSVARNNWGSSNGEALSQALHHLIGPGRVFDEAATVLLAVGFTHQAPTCRAVALETLLAAVETGRLLPSALGEVLGQLLSAEFVPVQRFADTLTQARAISPRTDDALRQLLDALLPALPTVALRNTKKLLELYADVLARGGYAAPAPVKAQLRAWSSVPALKKTAVALAA